MPEASRPSALLLNLLATARGPMPVAALVEAGALFELTGNNVRVALRRLCEAGRVERVGAGLYALAPGAAPLNRRVRAWSRAPRVRRWDGTWLVLPGAPRAGTAGARGLRLFGFAEDGRGRAVRPANLAAGPAEVAGELGELGVEAAGDLLVARPADPARESAWRGLWDAAALGRAHASTARELEESLGRLAALPPAAALRESFETGGAAIRQLAYDPLLPEAIAPAAPREALRAVLRRYDRAGRALWAAFMDRFDLGPRREGLHATPFAAPLAPTPLHPEEAP